MRMKGQSNLFHPKIETKQVCVSSAQNWYVHTLLLGVFSTGVFLCNKGSKIWIFVWICLWIFCLYQDSCNFNNKQYFWPLSTEEVCRYLVYGTHPHNWRISVTRGKRKPLEEKSISSQASRKTFCNEGENCKLLVICATYRKVCLSFEM
jgi:hypothetical protein